MRFLSLIFLLLLAACATPPFPPPEDAPLTLRRAAFADLPGWSGDRQDEALAAFRVSCGRILAKDPLAAFGPFGGTYGEWAGACRAAESVPAADPAAARAFFEHWFTPYAAYAGEFEKGLFTGYFEPLLRGSLKRGGEFQTPLLARPADLVMVELGDFRDELKGQRIAGRVKDGYLKPFEDRAAITAGRLPENSATAIAWVDDPVDAFFLQVQGSGRIALERGDTLRVGYDGQNGYPYYAIGRELVKRGELTKETVSLDTIRAWLESHPEQARDLMNLNRSYVFFKVLEGPGPLGGEGLPLTPGRSLAVDRARLSYGVPVYVDIAPPASGEGDLQRLMVAQDTGGAIRGAVRGDVFWGAGDRAKYLAGNMKSPGRWWILLPRGVSPPS